MSRLLGFFITIVYTVSAAIIGYYGHILRLTIEASETGVNSTMLVDFIIANPWVGAAVATLLMAILTHRASIGQARHAMNIWENESLMLRSQLRETEHILDEKNAKMDWVEQAIERAVIEDARQQREERLNTPDETPRIDPKG